MIKQKLINKRRELNLTQEEVAFRIGIPTSSYNRRENGITTICKKEWNKLVIVLDTTLNDIYEPNDGVYFVSSEKGETSLNTKNNFSRINEFVVKTLKKYIKKIEKENAFQKQEIERLKQSK